MSDCDRYSDFFHLNQALRAEFPHLSFSPFPKKILFGRSQVQSVASKRMGELNAYLQVEVTPMTNIVYVLSTLVECRVYYLWVLR